MAIVQNRSQKVVDEVETNGVTAKRDSMLLTPSQAVCGRLRSVHPVLAPLVQAALSVCSLQISLWARAPWLCIVGLVLVGLGALMSRPLLWPPARRHWLVLIAWSGTMAALLGIILARIYTLDLLHAAVAGQTAIVVWLAGREAVEEAIRSRWKVLATSWAFLATGLWLGVTYRDNAFGLFHGAVVANVVLLLACRRWFQLSALGIQVVNSLVLVLIGLPVCDLLIRPSYRPPKHLDPAKREFSYTAAGKDPATFFRWHKAFWAEWDAHIGHVFMNDPARQVPVRLRPSSETTLLNARISINSLGFRGREIALEKGPAYRIVAMGESTTFGFTINPGEKPWPELLEEMIRDRLHPKRPVEVINAGVPANDLRHALLRFPREILPLQPDMIVSYHGANGFGWLQDSLPSRFYDTPPEYRRRPLKLVADCEYRLRVTVFKRRVLAQHTPGALGLTDPLQTRYAGHYRHFIQAVQTNGIRLVLANFSMAVNGRSDRDVVAFYRPGYPSAYWQIRANEVHSGLVETLARQDTNICFVDTHPGLDGEHEKFIDLGHLTQEGRQQLAENIFAGIKEVLETDLARGASAQPAQ